jgi:predicted  nucleic acid-binding Zn-ribbon protein
MEDIKKRIAKIEDAIRKLEVKVDDPSSAMSVAERVSLHNRLSAMQTTLSAMQAEKNILLQRGTAPLALASSSTSDSIRADRSGINDLGAHLASLSREHGGGARLRDYGFDSSCPVCTPKPIENRTLGSSSFRLALAY